MQYYILTETSQAGPFELDELLKQKLTKETLVWYDGLFEWTKAGEILELLDAVNETAPDKPRIKDLLIEMKQTF